MDAFVQPLYELADFDAIIRQLKKPGIVQVSGCLDSQKAHFTNGLLREFPFRLIVAENDLKAKAFYEDFRLYDPEVLYYPATLIHGTFQLQLCRQVYCHCQYACRRFF